MQVMFVTDASRSAKYQRQRWPQTELVGTSDARMKPLQSRCDSRKIPFLRVSFVSRSRSLVWETEIASEPDDDRDC